MKKMIKLSLVAAVAVAGLTTSATAGSLEDAIKGVTISGQMNVEYENKQTKVTNTTKTNTNQKEYDFDVTANIPVNDTITAQIGFQADNDVQENENGGTDSTVKTDIANGVNNSGAITLTKLNFTAKTDVATVIVGKQKQPTPFLDDERGDGVVALIPAGPVTVAAGHFTGMIGGQGLGGVGTGVSSSLDDRDISAAAIIGTFGPVNAQAWYLQASGADSTVAAAVSTLENGVKGYALNLAADIEGIKVELNHAQTELQNEGGANWDAESLTKLTVSTAVAGVNLVAGYGMTNDTDTGSTNAGRVLGADLTGDNDAKNNFAMDQLALDDLNDASAFLIGASMQAGAYNVGVAYLDGDSTTGAVKTDISELDLTVSYAMSKNFTLKGIYAMDEVKTTASKTENDTLTLRATYKF